VRGLPLHFPAATKLRGSGPAETQWLWRQVSRVSLTLDVIYTLSGELKCGSKHLRRSVLLPRCFLFTGRVQDVEFHFSDAIPADTTLLQCQRRSSMSIFCNTRPHHCSVPLPRDLELATPVSPQLSFRRRGKGLSFWKTHSSQS